MKVKHKNQCNFRVRVLKICTRCTKFFILKTFSGPCYKYKIYLCGHNLRFYQNLKISSLCGQCKPKYSLEMTEICVMFYDSTAANETIANRNEVACFMYISRRNRMLQDKTVHKQVYNDDVLLIAKIRAVQLR